jgi:pimeloyl-ACP methyl ester carboxylesterase
VTLSVRPGAPLIFLLRMASPEAGVWDTIWRDLATRFSVAAFDLQQLRAARAMERPEAVFVAAGDACAAIASGLERQRFHLLGWNGGTQVALRCAVDHAERVASLLLLDPFYELPDMRHVETGIAFKRLLFEHDRALYARYWIMAGLSDRFIAAHFDRVEALAEARLRSDRFINQTPERFMRWVRALRRNWISEEEFARLRLPTLILATEYDRWNAGPSVAMAEAVQQRIAGAELRVIEGFGGHFLIEAPERFEALAGPFLERVSTL